MVSMKAELIEYEGNKDSLENIDGDDYTDNDEYEEH